MRELSHWPSGTGCAYRPSCDGSELRTLILAGPVVVVGGFTMSAS